MSAVGVQFACVAPLLTSAYLLSWWLWENIEHNEIRQPNLGGWALAPGAVFAFLSLLLASFSRLGWRAEERLLHPKAAPFAAATLAALGTRAAGWALFRGHIAFLGFLTETQSGPWHALVCGPPLLLLVFSIAAVVHVGLLGVDLLDSAREWLGRFRAVTNIYTLFWLALFCASIYGGLWFGKFEIWSGHAFSALSGAWIVTTVGSFLAGRSPKTGDEGSPGLRNSALQALAKAGPPVFAAGFVWAVAIGMHLLVGHSALAGGKFFDKLYRSYWIVLGWSPYDGHGWAVAAPAVLVFLCTAVALLLAWRADINEFSMHHFYKNRLVRCYLGASNQRRSPNLFTGFDEQDDIHLAKFRASNGYAGPYHIVNATLNLSAGKDLAWQERKAASFIFTPCYCGYDASQGAGGGPEYTGGALRPCAYRKTDKYAFKEGIGIGTAMAISGAAADPNQGYNTSPAVAFLMTVFDVRLGWWLGNPRRDTESKLPSPRFGLAALISELSGTTDDATHFVSLSDGGHFDNMGIYELVRRRCKYIVLSDAEQDGSYQFGGLGMAIRKCRIDFGVEIEIDPRDIVPHGTPRLSERHCAVARIRYPKTEGREEEEGVLLYIKSSMTGDEPEDLIEYSKTHPDFPHETTADQWFTESQFESYRKLGYHAARSTLEPARIFAENPEVISDLFEALKNYWYPMNPGLRPHANKHTRTLNEMFDKISATPGLRKLGAQVFKHEESRDDQRDPEAEFYFSMSVIQLVEDIYFDFNLDREEWRTDPRIGGWMNLFRQWKQVDAIKSAWGKQRQTFRRDFQKFWDELPPPG